MPVIWTRIAAKAPIDAPTRHPDRGQEVALPRAADARLPLQAEEEEDGRGQVEERYDG